MQWIIHVEYHNKIDYICTLVTGICLSIIKSKPVCTNILIFAWALTKAKMTTRSPLTIFIDPFQATESIQQNEPSGLRSTIPWRHLTVMSSHVTNNSTFCQQLVQANKNGIIKYLHYWPLHWAQWASQEGVFTWNQVMTSLWCTWMILSVCYHRYLDRIDRSYGDGNYYNYYF